MAMNTKEFLDKNLKITEDIGLDMNAVTFRKLGKAQKESLKEVKNSLLSLCQHGVTDLDRIKMVMSDIDSRIESIDKAINLRSRKKDKHVAK